MLFSPGIRFPFERREWKRLRSKNGTLQPCGDFSRAIHRGIPGYFFLLFASLGRKASSVCWGGPVKKAANWEFVAPQDARIMQIEGRRIIAFSAFLPSNEERLSSERFLSGPYSNVVWKGREGEAGAIWLRPGIAWTPRNDFISF
ncbi:hypothetical protein CEXT_444001 [Caerostris extrusa]|uniref:Uncharacterized protein n=1 Tax=Caerostris extrusa TaxID=172846 RepID=A0AAV4SMM2_CAEEX|nr:hypothetical protein CEXT_444001 [Caerostris extrusa]